MRLLLAACLCLPALAQPTVRFDRETMRLRSATVTAQGSAFNLLLAMENDNGVADGVLPTSFRRWWHCEIGNLNPAGQTLNVTIDRAGYTDVILPVWSLSTDGTTFGTYSRVPVSATPTVSGVQHRFTLQTPAGVRALRLAKYFPYTIAEKDALLARVGASPRTRAITVLGNSVLGRPIQMVELTDGAVPDAGKKRVWVHTCVHPAETTAFFVTEGLLDFLVSGDPLAEVLLDRLIFDVVPMANPDGVFRGNYRTNANGVNLEEQWTAPYTSTVAEIVALRTRIEAFMGTVATPGSNPIEVLLNLHASHGVAYPFHFQHTANASFDLVNNRTGVLPVVNQAEGRWINASRARSPLVARGTTQTSSAGAPTRPFVESMAHDRWTSVAGWLSAGRAPVMAITYEGTYGRAADGVTWNTPTDYRTNGREMALAIADYFGLRVDADIARYGTDCGGPTLAVSTLTGAGVTLRFAYSHQDLNAVALLALGTDRQALPLPNSSCLLRTTPVVSLFLTRNAQGQATLDLPMPLVAGFRANAQGLSWSAAAGFGSTAGAELTANF
jgi:hypothetical protein